MNLGSRFGLDHDPKFMIGARDGVARRPGARGRYLIVTVLLCAPPLVKLLAGPLGWPAAFPHCAHEMEY